jgi:hypothetical protein
LEDDFIFGGTKSSTLFIVPISEAEYTFDGDYYYCTITSQCGFGNLMITSAQCYLLPGHGIVITREPINIYACKSNLTATFEIHAFTSEEVAIQYE